MNTFRTLSLLLAFVACSQLSAATYEALIVAVKGTAFEVDSNQKALRTLAPNATVAEGNGVRTSNNATLTLVLANGAVITLEPDTIVFMEQLQIDGDASLSINKPLTPSPADTRTRLRINRGEILGEVKGLSPRTKFEITSFVGTAGITGTKFTVELVEVSPNRFALIITNLDGTVDANANTAASSEFSVSAGDQTIITATYDSDTGEITDLETATETLPDATLQTLINGISENVGDITENLEVKNIPQIYLPIELIQPDEINDSQIIVIGTNT